MCRSMDTSFQCYTNIQVGMQGMQGMQEVFFFFFFWGGGGGGLGFKAPGGSSTRWAL